MLNDLNDSTIFKVVICLCLTYLEALPTISQNLFSRIGHVFDAVSVLDGLLVSKR